MTAPSPRPARPLSVVAGRLPATLSLVAALLVAGLAWQGLWRPFEDSDLFDVVAYGLPAFEAGRWWTPVTGLFFVSQPWVYLFTIGGFVGMAYLEWRRGSIVALAYFGVGHLFAVFGSALVLWLCAMLPWPWAQEQALVLDVGPSGGTMACIAAAVALLAAPWRIRALLVLLAFVFLAMLFWGELADLEHLLAVLLVLVVDRSLRVQRTTVREQRLIAFTGMLVLGVVQLITLVVPTDGVFGPTEPVSGGFLDFALDSLVIVLIANGLRRGRRWAWVVAVVLGAINIVTAALVLTLVVVLSESAVEGAIAGETELALASGSMWLMLLVYLLWVRGAFRARRRSRLGSQPAPDVDEVKEQLRLYGGGTLSWMTTWDGLEYARTEHGIVAFRRRGGVALALADPIGPAADRAAAVREFIGVAERAGLIPCFFSVDDRTAAAVPSSWHSLVVADDTIVDLPGLEFTGKRWNSVRTALNRAGRDEMTVRLTRLADEPWGVRQQLRAISEAWVGDKGLPEMGFTLGTLVEAEDPEVRLAIAISPDGDVDGFLSWLPVHGEGGRIRGWTLDLMRRRDGGFGPVMELLIGWSAREFSAEGAEVMSLSGAPLAHEYPEGAGLIAPLSEKLAETLEPVYGFRSLHRFKEKFHPRYETLSLLYRDESDLARVGGALTRAFLPEASLRQFADAGLELVRGSRD
ncbi:lysylphosphatidylglycerol synthetase-like protein (DUF2156 family) [Microbacterium terrae]|uniref:Phosphatidylglycerol lysyltransferase n=1 Tax=Microbacterium terrae TaxID=69369 RepID=A0A0M2GXJ2_9MICO|nr:DUF2156 domain-containing protein [Microbacterium terrae]KJL38459.1 Phosphatidylglycerol lysyltransferase [Microbacterium terrae]MBP1078898.1 lysylphosphatidylglycerol synthetase-like protein (DUF2156 family) [Microbacterium terrae]GLJ98298.1 hypothetical protein GCM10017594_14950 [Microbacterium terrae]